MIRKRRQHGKWRLLAVTLVCLLVAVNASQGMVLCFGAHGHVAFEPAGHRHCDGTIHYDDADRGPIGEDTTGYVLRQWRDPCVDIPLSLGPLDERNSSSVLKTTVALSVTEPPSACRNAHARVATSHGAVLATHSASLRTTVLQV
jgi:hypothetical protein